MYSVEFQLLQPQINLAEDTQWPNNVTEVSDIWWNNFDTKTSGDSDKCLPEATAMHGNQGSEIGHK